MDYNYSFFLLIFLTSFAVATVTTPLMSKFALKKSIVDLPGVHKTHTNPKPLLGGLALFMGFAATVFLFLDVDDKLISFVASTLVLVITGLLDDMYNLKPLLKLGGQLAAAIIIVLWNTHSYHVIVDYFDYFSIPEYLILALIIGWIVLMVNSFNLIDGLDGLAAGTAAIIFLAMLAITLIGGVTDNMLGVQLIGLGACLGFLIFNFNPAKIFMGDTGSMLLGFMLANTYLFTINYPFSASLVLASLFVFAYPALDVSFAIYRRICFKCPIFKADRGHIHHVLRSLGFSVRKTVLILYGVNIFFALFAVILLTLDLHARVIMVIGGLTLVGVFITFRKLLQISERNEVAQHR